MLAIIISRLLLELDVTKCANLSAVCIKQNKTQQDLLLLLLLMFVMMIMISSATQASSAFQRHSYVMDSLTVKIPVTNIYVQAGHSVLKWVSTVLSSELGQ